MDLYKFLEAFGRASKDAGYKPFEDVKYRLILLIKDLVSITESDNPGYIAQVERKALDIIEETCYHLKNSASSEETKSFISQLCEQIRRLVEAIGISQLQKIGYKLAAENCIKSFASLLLAKENK